MKLGKAIEALPIINWLVSKRNSNGGFISTQDTVIALQALAEAAPHIHTDQLDMTITITSDNDSPKVFSVNQKNKMAMQSQNLSPNVRSVYIEATGIGIVSAQVAYSYNKKETVEGKGFDLNVNLNLVDEKLLKLTICAKAVSYAINDGLAKKMTLIEVTLPSGFVFDESFKLNDKIRVSLMALPELNYFIHFKFHRNENFVTQRLLRFFIWTI